MNDKNKIIVTCLKIYNEKGTKMTMDDIAKAISISKKTLYTLFDSKEDLFAQMINYCFDQIDYLQETIFADKSLSHALKLSKLLCSVGDYYTHIDSPDLVAFKSKYPDMHDMILNRIDRNWSRVASIIIDGQEQGVFKMVNPIIIKYIYESALTKFFSTDFLLNNNIDPKFALTEAVDTITRGITIKNPNNKF